MYAAIPGLNKYRPSQETPIPRFTLAGDWTSQKFLGSMEGAVLGGKLAAEVIADRAVGNPTKGLKAVQPSVVAAAAAHVAKEPVGVKGSSAISFGGGQVLSKDGMKLLGEQDAEQVVGADPDLVEEKREMAAAA